MKKSKIFIVGLIALLMAGGLVLVGCKTGCPNDKCSVTISGDGSKGFDGCSQSGCASKKAYDNGSAAATCDC
jgi:hypothetical protein